MKTIKTLTKLIAVVAALVITSCKEETSAIGLAVVGTEEIKTFTKTTATIDGKISSDGGSPIIEKGVCFGTSTAPTIADTKVANGSGKEDFTTNITNLSLNTTYYIRTYATNKVGTSYGNEVVLTTAGVDIYLAGGINNDAGYWKNNVYTALSTNATSGTFATAIAVSGNDVYATGFTGNFLVMWKNGVMTKLTDGTNSNVTAADIVVNGSDVYVGGWEKKGGANQVAKYWKNGVEVSLSDGSNSAVVTAMFISGTDVYACGVELKNGIGVAKYWKNGVSTPVTDGTRHAAAQSIFVKGTDVYVAGHEQNTASQLVAKYWKNGVATSLSDGSKLFTINDIFVNDNAVYSTGFSYTNDFTVGDAWLWTNTTIKKLVAEVDAGYTQGRKISVSGSDVYIYGTKGGKTVIWKNGTLLAPYDGTFPVTNLVADMFISDK